MSKINWGQATVNALREETKEKLSEIKENRPRPTQCHLWQKESLVSEDIYSFLDVIKTYVEDSHFSRRLVKCKDCGQLYLKEFYEEIDWIDGEDPQYLTFIPVKDEEEAEIISKVDLFEFQCFSPRLNDDYPKERPKRIYWVGK